MKNWTLMVVVTGSGVAMSDLITDEMADAFNKVMRDRAAIYGKPVEPGPIREDTKAALEAVVPFTFGEADLRERIATAIEAEQEARTSAHRGFGSPFHEGLAQGFRAAADIARGKDQT